MGDFEDKGKSNWKCLLLGHKWLNDSLDTWFCFPREYPEKGFVRCFRCSFPKKFSYSIFTYASIAAKEEFLKILAKDTMELKEKLEAIKVLNEEKRVLTEALTKADSARAMLLNWRLREIDEEVRYLAAPKTN